VLFEAGREESMESNEPDIGPLANLERRFKKNPGLYANPKAREAIEEAARREMELLEAKMWRYLVDFTARFEELKRDIAASKGRR
jgi:hypothetical protein